jgi:hypothetical protein
MPRQPGAGATIFIADKLPVFRQLLGNPSFPLPACQRLSGKKTTKFVPLSQKRHKKQGRFANRPYKA